MKNSGGFKILILFVLVFLFFQSCKKEAEVTYPVIKVSQPSENQTFGVLDTIQIKAEITHTKNLTNVSMAVVDMNLIPVTNSFNTYPNQQNYTINTNIIISNIELSSGNYYLHIRATDGVNETNSYTKIYINEAPYILENVFLITKTPLSSLNISKLDTSLQATNMFNLNSDFGYADVDPINKLLYICGKYSSKIYCYDYQNNAEKWNNMVQGYPPQLYFNDLMVHNKKVYIAIHQNAIIAYNPDGTIMYNLPTSNDRYPDKIHFHNQFLISSQHAISNQNTFININYLESGGFCQLLQLNLKIIKFISKDDNNIYVFANDLSDNAELRIYDMTSNGVWEPYNLGTGKMVAAEKIDNNSYFIAYENKIIKFSYNPIGAVPFISNISPVSMKFDFTSQKLYVVTTDKKIMRYSYPFGTLEKQVSVSDSICELVLGYNKPVE